MVSLLMSMDLLWVELGLPNVGLGFVLPPLRYGLGLVTLIFLLYSIIICFAASGSPPQIS